MADGEFDLLLMPMTMLSEEQSAVRVATAQAVAADSAPVALCWLGGSLAAPGVERADETGVACFTSTAGLIRAMTGVRRRADARRRWRDRVVEPTPAPLEMVAPGVMSYPEALDLLARFDVPGPPQSLVTGADAAIEAAARLGYPVALKQC